MQDLANYPLCHYEILENLKANYCQIHIPVWLHQFIALNLELAKKESQLNLARRDGMERRWFYDMGVKCPKHCDYNHEPFKLIKFTSDAH